MYFVMLELACLIDLAKRRIAFLGRSFNAATLSSAPDSRLAPEMIVIREQPHLEVHGGCSQSH